MPWSALPERLRTPEAWKGTDMDTPLFRWTLKIKGWFAFGPRATEWWARWSQVPFVILGANDGSSWRVETDALSGKRYVSRVQYWSRWHFLIQWPLSISCHRYWRKEDVPAMGVRPTDMGIKKLIFAYGPTHFDADSVYWILSFFLGGQWK